MVDPRAILFPSPRKGKRTAAPSYQMGHCAGMKSEHQVLHREHYEHFTVLCMNLVVLLMVYTILWELRSWSWWSRVGMLGAVTAIMYVVRLNARNRSDARCRRLEVAARRLWTQGVVAPVTTEVNKTKKEYPVP